ncbi:hypothetical protein [Ferrimonas pelagia]|uniref:Uncharacterized protein n=1 Tax=Ferrimonas pelagia TaxID=1177826 RepID=A0ABP9ESD2_9GAMM
MNLATLREIAQQHHHHTLTLIADAIGGPAILNPTKPLSEDLLNALGIHPHLVPLSWVKDDGEMNERFWSALYRARVRHRKDKPGTWVYRFNEDGQIERLN